MAEKDISQIIRYLSNTLNQVTAGLEKPVRGNAQYIIQTEFAYLLNEIMQGPKCLLQKHIADCNEFIDQVIQELAS